MIGIDLGRIEGYDYPEPSIERGQTPIHIESNDTPFSQESLARFRDFVRRGRAAGWEIPTDTPFR